MPLRMMSLTKAAVAPRCEPSAAANCKLFRGLVSDEGVRMMQGSALGVWVFCVRGAEPEHGSHVCPNVACFEVPAKPMRWLQEVVTQDVPAEAHRLQYDIGIVLESSALSHARGAMV